jgi:anaerobic magnesium-protoporphyrin IX monomethyl ester cyclase
MKLVLINSPIQKYSADYKPEYRTSAPLGLGQLGTIARLEGIDTTIVDAESEKLSVEEITGRVNGMKPDAVGINMTSPNYQISLEIIDRVNAERKLIGGAHVTLKSKEIYRQVEPRGNYLVVKGEAEDVFLDCLTGKRKTGIIEGGRTQNLDRLPFIDRSLFVNDPFEEDGRVESSMHTARGCPYSCAFCSVPTISGRTMRARSVENVLDEMEQLNSLGVNSIHFLDDLFNFSFQRVEELCEGIVERGLDMTWRALARVELLNPSLLEAMSRAGCYKLSFGLESGVKSTLEYNKKCTDLDFVRRIFSTCGSLGIQTKAFFTIGYPHETEQDIAKTIDFASSLKADEAYFMVVRAFPGTRLYDEMRARGSSEKDLEDYKQSKGRDKHVKYHVMNLSSLNGMSNEKLDGFIKQAYKRFYQEK